MSNEQETLEEAAEHNYPGGDVWTEEQALIRRLAFKNGAKWQQERMYSEEEVIKLLISCKDRFGGSDLHDYTHDNEVKTWFERNKKK
jgi:hypothetical protein